MKISLSRIPAWAWTLPSLLLLSCGGDASREALPDWGAGYVGDGGGVPDDPAGAGKMSLAFADDIGVPARMYDVATLDECAMEIDGTLEGRQEIVCRMDLNELDLYGLGLIFDFHVPENGCDWIRYWHYQYEAYETGFGPTDVSYAEDDDGNITNEVNSRGGEPFCIYDHKKWTDPDWPNCCMGTYTLAVTDVETMQVTTYPPKSWNGKPSECYAGAAFVDKEAVLDDDGWPLSKLVFVARAAFHKRFEFGSSAEDYSTNLAYANYYDPDDHGGTAPAGLGPMALRPVPHYNFYCLDHAEEIIGSIRLVVREWNEEREFFAKGDPDTVGFEPGTMHPLNDRKDWLDATPGSITWVHDED